MFRLGEQKFTSQRKLNKIFTLVTNKIQLQMGIY